MPAMLYKGASQRNSHQGPVADHTKKISIFTGCRSRSVISPISTWMLFL